MIIDGKIDGKNDSNSSSLSGALVHADLKKIDQIKKDILAFEGVEIHAVDENGKIVITIEERGGNKIMANTLISIQDIEGVYSASLIYEYSGDDLDE
ncbi:MAG: hypothetical protein DRQ51_06575 [Gammaproteobacteria bacterium]|nr:MAG: hypothetical protein DRQ51_06575 [Gammaproteobacteria bacterium]